jgi:hypothetical protein
MDYAITTNFFYCLLDDFSKAMRHRDDPQQVRFSSAEAMTVSSVAT